MPITKWNSTWFCNDKLISAQIANDPIYSINSAVFASEFAMPKDHHVALVWNLNNTLVPAIDVTNDYKKQCCQ